MLETLELRRWHLANAGGRGGRGSLLLREGHTPTMQWKGSVHTLGSPLSEGSRDRHLLSARLSLKGG